MKHATLVSKLKKHGIEAKPWENFFRVETDKAIGTWIVQGDRALCVSTLSRAALEYHDPMNDCRMDSYHHTVKSFLNNLGL